MDNELIAVIGLGYVGLPLAVELGKKRNVLGLDINKKRVKELSAGKDYTLEVSPENLKAAKYLTLSSDPESLKNAQFYIVTVPTPVDDFKNPDLGAVKGATEMIASCLKKGDIIVYESTVYPGVTEEVCVPILEEISGMQFNKDFYCGFSPERINPGDKIHTLTKVTKVVSGSTPEALDKIAALYESVVEPGVYRASSVRVAEASKVIENAQRDINIAFVNELARIFNLMGIDTREVLEAAGTKWNFLNFSPGLVGGHCIGVDPYYLANKAQSLGYNPEIILAGRRMNDTMGPYVASRIVKLMIQKGHTISGSKILVLGITFKENCPDIRNTKVVELINELKDYGCEVHVFDPWADKEDVKEEYGIFLTDFDELDNDYDAQVLAVSHEKFNNWKRGDYEEKGKGVFYDIKGFFNKTYGDARL